MFLTYPEAAQQAMDDALPSSKELLTSIRRKETFEARYNHHVITKEILRQELAKWSPKTRDLAWVCIVGRIKINNNKEKFANGRILDT